MDEFEFEREEALISGSDEKYQKVKSKIGEGATSEVFKVRDTRTGRVIYKKVIKEINDEDKFKIL